MTTASNEMRLVTELGGGSFLEKSFQSEKRFIITAFIFRKILVLVTAVLRKN